MEPIATDIIERLKMLRKPFEAHQISKLPKPTKAQTDEVKNNFKAGIRCDICGAWHHPKVVHLDYVGHAALTDRLLDVDPGWSWEPLATDEKGLPAIDKDGGLWIKLTICGVTRLGYGDAQGKTGGDAMKERIGDALRNAAMRFGAALDLWHKGVLHLDAEDDAPAQPDSVGLANAVNAIKGAATIKEIGEHLKAAVAMYPDSKTALQKHASERKAQLNQQLAEQA
jgi:hypothetical protein